MTAGSQVLDVAAGNGNASLAAARRGCAVTATDYVEALLAGAQRRADAEGLRHRSSPPPSAPSPACSAGPTWPW